MRAVQKHIRLRLPPRRRGITAVLAMLYLILFSALAIGFYSATATQVIVVDNERRGTISLAAAETGMDYIRYKVSKTDIKYTLALGASSDFSIAFNALASQLKTAMDNTQTAVDDAGNVLGAMTVATTTETIQIPGNTTQWVKIDDSGMQFRATLTKAGTRVRVKVTGRGPDRVVKRALQLDYDIIEKKSTIFDYGVASKGRIVTGGNAKIKGLTDPTKGSVLSLSSDATPVAIGGKLVSGDISIQSPTGTVTYTGASVGGTTDPTEIAAKHIHKGVTPPDFPVVDTDIYYPYVVKKDSSGNPLVDSTTGKWIPNYYTTGKVLNNMVIRANTNPKFTGGANITGVLYIETPNVVTFAGNSSITGVIVTQNNPTGTISTNQINFTGSVVATGTRSLDGTDPQYKGLDQLTGAFLLAKGFAASFSGDFGTVAGSIIADKVSMTGNAAGTVQGSVIGMEDNPLTANGSSEIIIASTGTTDVPAGVHFNCNLAPAPDTYREVLP